VSALRVDPRDEVGACILISSVITWRRIFRAKGDRVHALCGLLVRLIGQRQEDDQQQGGGTGGPPHVCGGLLPESAHPIAAPTTVLIAEARAMAADAMARVVSRGAGLTLVGKCANRTDVATVCAEAQPGVAVIDLGLYDHDANDAVRSVHEHAARTKILLVAPQLDAAQFAAAMMAGADNCISARADARAFLLSLRATADGRSIVSHTLQQRALELVAEMGVDGVVRLSPRELQVLRLIADGLSVGAIAERLFVSSNTAKTLLRRSYQKLGVNSRAAAVAVAMRTGILH